VDDATDDDGAAVRACQVSVVVADVELRPLDEHRHDEAAEREPETELDVPPGERLTTSVGVLCGLRERVEQ